MVKKTKAKTTNMVHSRKMARNSSAPHEKISRDTRKRAIRKKIAKPINTENSTQRIERSVQENINTVHVDHAGRIVVPANIRKELDLSPGTSLSISIDGDSLRLVTIKAALHEIRNNMRKINPKKKSLVSELISQRRLEASKE